MYAEGSNVLYGKDVTIVKLLEVSLVGVGTVCRLEGGAWSTVN